MNDLAIIHEDSALVVVNKPGGLLAVPGRGPHKQDCVVNRIKKLYRGCLDQPAVHRLDMFTSGLMVLARTRDCFVHLSRQFETREVQKEYIAILDGEVEAEGGTIDLCFRLDPDNRPHQVYDPVHGKRGLTRWEKVAVADGQTLVRFHPETGRTHQLRLHAAHPEGLGVPIVGDSLYGNGSEGDPMLLHAGRISFVHPDTDQQVQFHTGAPFSFDGSSIGEPPE